MGTLPGLKGMMPRTLGAPQKAMPYWFTFGPAGAPGTHTWVCPFTTIWRFVLWGGGSGGYDPDVTGGSGSGLLIAERPLRAGDLCSVNVAPGGNGGSSSAANTTVTLPTGEVLTGPGGNTSAPPTNMPTLRPSDILLPWSGLNAEVYVPAGNNPGERGFGLSGPGFYQPSGNGAAGWGPYRGGNGGDAYGSIKSGFTPGGGGATGGGTVGQGGDGMAIIHPVEGL